MRPNDAYRRDPSGPWTRSAASAENAAPDRRRTAEPSTTTLLRRADAGDQVAWNALVDRYTKLLWSVARGHRLGTADAGDVVQTTWLRLVEHLGQINDPERLASWLVTTARRECLRLLRRGRNEVVGAVDDLVPGMADDAEPLDAHLLTDERDAMLWTCFRQLSERCRLLLRILMNTPPPAYADVAAALGVPIGSIGPTRGRCLERLRSLAGQAGLGPIELGGRPAERWA
jgi:RNA polymerase sigma factor (sigma-70 family)